MRILLVIGASFASSSYEFSILLREVDERIERNSNLNDKYLRIITYVCILTESKNENFFHSYSLSLILFTLFDISSQFDLHNCEAHPTAPFVVVELVFQFSSSNSYDRRQFRIFIGNDRSIAAIIVRLNYPLLLIAFVNAFKTKLPSACHPITAVHDLTNDLSWFNPERSRRTSRFFSRKISTRAKNWRAPLSSEHNYKALLVYRPTYLSPSHMNIRGTPSVMHQDKYTHERLAISRPLYLATNFYP